jgi:hypothetical protein
VEEDTHSHESGGRGKAHGDRCRPAQGGADWIAGRGTAGAAECTASGVHGTGQQGRCETRNSRGAGPPGGSARRGTAGWPRGRGCCGCSTAVVAGTGRGCAGLELRTLWRRSAWPGRALAAGGRSAAGGGRSADSAAGGGRSAVGGGRSAAWRLEGGRAQDGRIFTSGHRGVEPAWGARGAGRSAARLLSGTRLGGVAACAPGRRAGRAACKGRRRAGEELAARRWGRGGR